MKCEPCLCVPSCEWCKRHCAYCEDCIGAKVRADGVPRCYMCGDTIAECDKRTDADGFNECEWLAEK